MSDLREWTAGVTAEYSAAGFVVKEHCGFPMVEKPVTQAETVRLLEFRPTRPVELQIYAEGMLVLPAGAGAILRERKAQR